MELINSYYNYFIFISVSPLHWNYDREKLDGHLAEAKGKPEFFKWSVPFYTLSVGAFSCYGDQALTTLQSLVENKGMRCCIYIINPEKEIRKEHYSHVDCYMFFLI